MFPIVTPISPETIARLSAISNDESDYQANVLKARKYDAGQQFVALTDRLRQFLGGDNGGEDFERLRLNICGVILDSVVDLLLITGFDTDEIPQEQPSIDDRGQATTKLIKPVSAWAWKIWLRNRMDAKQRRVHEMTLRDSEAFVLVDWDDTSKRPRFTPHQRFVDGAIGGDNEGCQAFYRNDDSDQDLLFVTKRWTQVFYSTGGQRQTRQRLTVYLPAEIRKYAGFPGAWKDVVDDDAEPWPIPWLDKKGQPLGIPVAHGISSAGMEASEAWPIQNLINKELVDLATESDIAAFRILVAFGWKPVDRDGNPITFTPGTIIGSENPNGRLEEFGGGDLSRFMNVIEGLIFWAASITSTPISRFTTTKQVAAEGTQKEQNSPLLTKGRTRQGELGNMWEHAMYMAMRIENTFGKGGLDESAFLTATWQPLEARDEDAELARAEVRKRLGMPIALIGAALGLTPEQISAWEEEVAQRAVEAAAQMQSTMQANQAAEQ